MQSPAWEDLPPSRKETRAHAERTHRSTLARGSHSSRRNCHNQCGMEVEENKEKQLTRRRQSRWRHDWFFTTLITTCKTLLRPRRQEVSEATAQNLNKSMAFREVSCIRIVKVVSGFPSFLKGELCSRIGSQVAVAEMLCFLTSHVTVL